MSDAIHAEVERIREESAVTGEPLSSSYWDSAQRLLVDAAETIDRLTGELAEAREKLAAYERKPIEDLSHTIQINDGMDDDERPLEHDIAGIEARAKNNYSGYRYGKYSHKFEEDFETLLTALRQQRAEIERLKEKSKRIGQQQWKAAHECYRAAIEAHIKDLRACASVLSAYPQFDRTRKEILKAADELDAALKGESA